MIMGTVEADWLKVAKNPEVYEEALEQLAESREEGEDMNINYFRQFDMPVHPKYIIEQLQALRFSNSEQTLMHVAMACYRTCFGNKVNQGMKFIESLMKCKFSMYLEDADGLTPLRYILVDSVPQEAVFPII